MIGRPARGPGPRRASVLLLAGLAALLAASCSRDEKEPAPSTEFPSASPAAAPAASPAAAPAATTAPASTTSLAPAAETVAGPTTMSSPAGSGLGRIEGVVRHAGNMPLRVKQLSNDIDTAACGERITLQTVVLGRDGAVANVFVELRADDGSLPPVPRASAPGETTRVAIRRCALEPHVLVVPSGSALEIRNQDGILHHLVVPALRNEPFDARLPRYRKRLLLPAGTLVRHEILAVSCDVHPWEVGWWIVTENPLRALTGPDGRFVIDGVPPGTWRLTAWHEDLRRTETSGSVAAGESVIADLAFR